MTMTVRIIGNEYKGNFQIVDVETGKMVGYSGNRALAELMVTKQGWTLVRATKYGWKVVEHGRNA
jgi:transposase